MSSQAKDIEQDIARYLSNNRHLSVIEKHLTILEAFNKHQIPASVIQELAVHMLIRMDEARQVLERERTLEPLIHLGYKNLREKRSASHKPRPGGRTSLVTEAKEIMKKSKRAGISFPNFFEHACNGSIEGLEIEKDRNGLYLVYVGDRSEHYSAKLATIKDWYTKSDKVGNSGAKSKP